MDALQYALYTQTWSQLNLVHQRYFCTKGTLFENCSLNLTIRYEIISLLKISKIRYEIKLQEENEHIYPTPNTQMVNCLKLD